MPANTTDLEKRLWDAADDLRANSKLKSSEYSMPVLGLIFLRYADHKFEQAEQELAGKATSRRRSIGKADYQARRRARRNSRSAGEPAAEVLRRRIQRQVRGGISARV
jgi:type I restriction-modification system DNA methylase subunit